MIAQPPPPTTKSINEMLSTYETVSEITEVMATAASEGEWDRLAALEANCKNQVGKLMQATPLKLNEHEQRAKVAIIRAILQNDAKIRAYTEPHLHALQQRLKTVQLAQRGIRAYGAMP
jgi:flagellar protein FliT